MRYLTILIFFLSACSKPSLSASDQAEQIMDLSIDFIEALKKGQDTQRFADGYSELDLDSLAAAIDTEEEKLAFWINTYNAFIQHLLNDDPTLFEDRGKFFSSKQMNIAGVLMSFDDIEHGIIRSSRWKLSLGYIRNPFAAKHIRMLRTKAPDGRIHFALNCGAASCPEIATYHANQVDAELDFIAERYLRKTTLISEESVTVTPLMSWFRADFGGKKGIREEFLLRYGIADNVQDLKLEFGDYDWSLSLGNFTDINLNE